MAMPGELDILMWVIGNSLVDPCSMSKYAILVRPGSTGKSTFMNYVSDALGAAVMYWHLVWCMAVMILTLPLPTSTAHNAC